MLLPKSETRLQIPAVALGALLLLGASAAARSGAAGSGGEAAEPTRGPIRYGRDVRPLLSDRCFRCHGNDDAKRKADLRLDQRASALAERDGVTAIVPGSPETSELWRRVTSDDPRERMPPAKSNKKPLSADELELVRRWIEDEAPYEPHWAFTPPTRPAVPAVEDASWARSDLDRFVLARLEAEGIRPSPEADRATLLRRTFLDLTGLPPTPAELDAFLADQAPDAFERQVRRLIREEPYASRRAEHMAVPWLDAARYADTSGIHMDAGRQIWPWRDWLLGALRDGMPFDRFLTEQLAGDLLPDATEAQKVASGFNRNHVTTDEGGAISEEYLVEYAVDRTATTGSVFLGLTLGCARCHDHKYDPISQEEFYGLYSFFNSIEEPGLYSQVPDPKRALEPFIEVPTDEQEARVEGIEGELAAAREALDTPLEGEEVDRAAFFDDVLGRAGVTWAASRVTGATSTGGATLTPREDGAVLASGENPDTDEHVLELETEGRDLRLVALEALRDPSLPEGRVGRAENGNAVLESIRAEAVSVTDPTKRRAVRFTWAWADVEQKDGDFRVVNALVDDGLGWAVDAHRVEGGRTALFLADEPFGFEGGTRLEVHLQYDSGYAKHALGCVRLSLGSIAEEGLDTLAVAKSGWYATAPFPLEQGQDVFEEAFGPEQMASLDLRREFVAGLRFNYVATFLDDRLNTELANGVNATYVARRYFSPTPRTIEVSLGSDDGFRLFLNGVEVAQNRVDRAVGFDQDEATLVLPSGVSTVVLKVVNTGGLAGYSWRTLRREDELAGDLAAALLPEAARTGELETRLTRAWRLAFSPAYAERVEVIAKLEEALAEVKAAIPRTMVMSELEEPRMTYVLDRGRYDHPDEDRPVHRGVPASLGHLPEGAPANRLGLARWMTSPENPLVARVAANRLWELCFGTGIVRTSEDFGLQGEWPSHPELLDWLAVELREGGWDTLALLEEIVTSSTYRQSSRGRPELADVDPGNRLLARYPRRRLGAEEIRDQALYVSGLLVEELGGPSVKPYQPEGLWKEVAMIQSNTRAFERGDGDDLYRRSLYTYWKRAAPPPSMLAFDAPTREFCTIRRAETTTPLQALVLWNDEQFVEASRVLAGRTLAEAEGDDARLTLLFRRCTGHEPDAEERAALAAALADFRERYRGAPGDAAALLEVGEAPADENDAAELAAWTLVASALFSLDATLTRS